MFAGHRFWMRCSLSDRGARARIAALVVLVTAAAMSLLLAAPACQAQVSWQENGVPVCAGEGDQQNLQIAPDGDSGAVIAWQDSRNGDWDVYAQRVSSQGASIWGAGVPVCVSTGEQRDPQVASDGYGGAVVAWTDDRNGNLDIYAQRLDSGGSPVWQANGVPVCVEDGEQQSLQIAPDGDSGAIIAWQDIRNGDWDIYAQRIGSGGNAVWGVGGVEVCKRSQAQTNPLVVSNEWGGAAIAWEDKRGLFGNKDIYAQRLSADGTNRWTLNGAPVCTDLVNQEELSIAGYRDGGIIAVWQDMRVFLDVNIYAQRMTADGIRSWGDSGETITYGVLGQTDPDVAVTDGNYVAAWADGRGTGGTDLYGKLGSCTSHDTIISSAEGAQNTVRVVSDGEGGSFVTWRDYRKGTGDSDIYAQRIDEDGRMLLENPAFPNDFNGYPLCTEEGLQENPRMVPGENGAAIVAWEDSRGADKDIYAQRVYDPKVQDVFPPGGWRGLTLDVSIHGELTGFTGDSRVFLDRNGRRIEASEVSCGGAEELTATFSIPGDAATGDHDLIVESGSETAAMCDCFHIEPGPPELRSVWPEEGDQGETLDVAISGKCTHFEQDETVVSFGEGIEVTELEVAGGCSCVATVRISDDARLGPRDITVVTERMENWVEEVGLEGSFLVRRDPPRIDSVSPARADIGERVPVSVEGANFRDGDRVLLRKGGQEDIVGEGLKVVDSGSITCSFDLEGVEAGSYSARVQSENGLFSVTHGAFTVEYPPPKISGIVPGVGTAGEVERVSVIGTDLREFAGVELEGPTTAADAGKVVEPVVVELVTSRELRCTFDFSDVQEGTYDISVTNPDGKRASRKDAFEVIPKKELDKPTWYLAEGTTSWGFETYISVQNPNEREVTARLTYMTPEGEVSGGLIPLPALSQTTVNPRDTLGEADFSTRVDSLEGETIAVDRTMYWTGRGAPSPEGHSSIGVNEADRTWYFAEGCSDYGFECWLLIQNPGEETANCRLTYMIEGEPAVGVDKAVPAKSRQSFSMADDIGERNASIMVESDRPVVAERAMYRNDRREGHGSVGAEAPAADYYLAEGSSNWGFTTYILVQNPNEVETDVTVTYMTEDGLEPQPTFTMPANSRKTIKANDAVPGKDFSTRVHGAQPIIAERAMYWDAGLGEACHATVGMSEPHLSFYLPDGQTSGGYETWTLVQNPNTLDVAVEVKYLTPDGRENRTVMKTVPGNTRMTFDMADSIPDGRAAIMVTSRTPGMEVMVERAMYWNGRGAGTSTIGGFED